MKKIRPDNQPLDPADLVPRATDRAIVRLEKAREYLRMISRLNRRLTRLTAPLIEVEAITSTQYLVLLWVRNRAGIMQGELSALLDLDANTISDVVRRLQRRRLLARTHHATDGRAYILRVTPEGAALVRRIRRSVDRVSLHLYSSLPAGHEAAVAAWLIGSAQIAKIPGPAKARRSPRKTRTVP